jgi:hypothetical protein
MENRMDKIESQVMPVPPNVLSSFKAGFDAITNQILIILIPIAIDLFIWLGPHLQIKTMLVGVINSMSASAEFSSIESAGILVSSKELISEAAEQLNLFSVLRTIPVGIPSIMSGRSPIEIPAGVPLLVDVKNPLAVALLVLVILLVGLCFGCFYYYMVVQAAFQEKLTWKRWFGDGQKELCKCSA